MSSGTTTLPEAKGQMMPGNSGRPYDGQGDDPEGLEHRLKDLEYRLKYLEMYHPKGKPPYESLPDGPMAPPEVVPTGLFTVRDIVAPDTQLAQVGTETAVTFIVVDINPVTFGETPVPGATVNVIVPNGVNAGISATGGAAKGQQIKLTTNARGEATVFFQGNQAGRVKLTATTATTFRLITEKAQIMVR